MGTAGPTHAYSFILLQEAMAFASTLVCHDGHITEFSNKFEVKVEFDVCLCVVFFGVVRCVQRHKNVSYLLDFLSSSALLWATFFRQFYLHNTQVGQWASDACFAASSDRGLIYNYLAVTIVSWIASSYLEYTSVVRFTKFYSTRLHRFTTRFLELKLSRSRKFVLLMAIICTAVSLLLIVLTWGAVQRSFENVSRDTSVFVFLAIAAFTRLARQFMEGLTFIAGIATRDFKWRNSNAEDVLGRIAFSSFSLLIHTSILTYAFANQNAKVWGLKQYFTLIGLCIDMIFRFVVCVWATYNSCCYIKATNFGSNLTNRLNDYYSRINLLTILTEVLYKVTNFVRNLTNRLKNYYRELSRLLFVTLLTSLTLTSEVLYTAAFHYCLVFCTALFGFQKRILNSTFVAAATVLKVTITVFVLIHYIIVLLVTLYIATWRNYILRWNEELHNEVINDPALEVIEQIPIQLLQQETRRDREFMRGEIVFPVFNLQSPIMLPPNSHAQYIQNNRHNVHQLPIIALTFGPLFVEQHVDLSFPLPPVECRVEYQDDPSLTVTDPPLSFCRLETSPLHETQLPLDPCLYRKEALVAPDSLQSLLFLHNRHQSEVVV